MSDIGTQLLACPTSLGKLTSKTRDITGQSRQHLRQVFDIAEGFAYSLSSFSHVHFEKVRQNYHNQCFKKKQDV